MRRSGDCSCFVKHLCHFEHCRSHSWVLLKAPQCHCHKPFHLRQIENCFIITLHQKINPAATITVICPVSQYFLIFRSLQLNIPPATDELQQDDPKAIHIHLGCDTDVFEPLRGYIASGTPDTCICLCLVCSEKFS